MFWRRRKRREQDWEREARAHLELEMAEQQESGLQAEQARYAARRLFGNSGVIDEQVREAWAWGWWDRFLQDLRYALRVFRRAPTFTAVVVLTLAVGIGADTAVFSILNGVLLQPLPYGHPDRLVVIWGRETHVKGTSKLFDFYSDYENWKKNDRSLEAAAAVSWATDASPQRILTGQGKAQTVFALPVTPDFFSLLGVNAMLGRTFTEADAGRGCMVVLAEQFWRNTFGGQKSIAGKSIRLDDQVCTVVGVMPASFAFLPPDVVVSMWTTMARPTRPNKFAVGVFARLRPGVSLATAQAEASALHHRLHEHERWGAQVEPIVYGLQEEFVWLTGRNLRLSLLVLFAAVSFVLLICCVNVANLLLSRALARQREVTIRATLGSSRARLLRQLFTENLALSALAAIAGIGLAVATVHYFRVARPVETPPGAKLEIDLPVVAFAVVLTLMTALIFGLMPAWRTSRVNLNAALKATGRSYSRGVREQWFAKALIVAEMTLTILLLSSAGLLIQTVNRFASAPLGFRPEGLLITSIRLPQRGYQTPQRRTQFYDRVRAELGEIPGVEGLAISNSRPIDGGGSIDVVEVQGHPKPGLENVHDTFHQTVSPDYFRIMRTPVEQGRGFEINDTDRTEPVAIVNEALVRRYLPNENPIGKHIRPFAAEDSTGPWLKIVGVVGNEKRTTVVREMAWVDEPIFYRPLSQDPLRSAVLLLRIENPSDMTIGASIRRKIAAIDPDVPVDQIQTVTHLESQALAYPRFRATLFGAFAALALILAIVGVFGVLSHSVAQRTHEIGLRMALGAGRATVLRMILREGLVLIIGGVLLGTMLAWLLGRYLAALLYGVQPTDPLLLASVALVLICAAFLSMYLPAQRASKIDPIVALRYE